MQVVVWPAVGLFCKLEVLQEAISLVKGSLKRRCVASCKKALPRVTAPLPLSRHLIGILLVISPERRSHMPKYTCLIPSLPWPSFREYFLWSFTLKTAQLRMRALLMWLLRSGLMTSRIPIKHRLAGKSRLIFELYLLILYKIYKIPKSQEDKKNWFLKDEEKSISVSYLRQGIYRG